MTGTTSLQRLRGISRDSAASHSPVDRLVAHPADVAAQHRVLVAQNQQLGVLGQITTEQHDQQPEHGTDDHVNKGEDHPR